MIDESELLDKRLSIRTPAIDLTPLVIDWITRGQIQEIKQLYLKVTLDRRCNRVVDKVVSVRFSGFFEGEEQAGLEWRAIQIATRTRFCGKSKHPSLLKIRMKGALYCRSFRVRPDKVDLAIRTLKEARGLRKDCDVEAHNLQNVQEWNCATAAAVRQLTIEQRLHLDSCIGWLGRNRMIRDCTGYDLRDMGLDVEASSARITALGCFIEGKPLEAANSMVAEIQTRMDMMAATCEFAALIL